MIYVYAIAIFLITISYDLYTDLKAKKVKHIRGALLRIPSFVAIYFITGWHFLFVCGAAYWLLFDVGFALGRNHHPFWLGTTSWLDKLQAPLPYWLRGVIKIGLFAGAVFLFTYNI
jgi:hypothetical protein